MSTRWFRSYEGMVSDPKLGEVSLIANTSRSVVVATWVAILESCAGENDGGRYATNARRIAVMLGEPVTAIEAVLAGLVEVGMIADGHVTAWAARQHESDNSSGRVKKHRAIKAATVSQPACNGDETECNGDETLHDRFVTASETETETETETEKIIDRRDARASESPPEAKPLTTPLVRPEASALLPEALKALNATLMDRIAFGLLYQIETWLAKGADPPLILSVCAQVGGQKPLNYLSKCVLTAIAEAQQPLPSKPGKPRHAAPESLAATAHALIGTPIPPRPKPPGRHGGDPQPVGLVSDGRRQ